MLELQKFFLVGIGGSLGAALRYLVSRIFLRFELAATFPFATLLVNLVGCFLIGLIASIVPNIENNQLTRLFLLTGIVGGFTTFSAFGMETFDLIQDGSSIAAAGYVAASVVLGLLAVCAGVLLAGIIK